MSDKCNKLKITAQIWKNEKEGRKWEAKLEDCFVTEMRNELFDFVTLLCLFCFSVCLPEIVKEHTRMRWNTLLALWAWGCAEPAVWESPGIQCTPDSASHWGQATWVMPWVDIRLPFDHLYPRTLFLFFWIWLFFSTCSPKMCNLQDSVQTLPLRLNPWGDRFTFPLHYCWPFAFKWCWETAVYKLLACDWWYQAWISVATNVFLLYFGFLLVLNVLINSLCHLTWM